jgi:hypothetical protein
MTNNPDYEHVVAAFVDGESVDAEQLRDALAHPEGRGHLIDLVALRQLVLAEPVAVPHASATARPTRATVWRALAMAAALLLAVASGYLFGSRLAARNGTTVVQAPQASDAPPKPTVVITVERWQDMQKGGGS